MILLLVILALPTSLYFSLYIPSVQRFVVQKTALKLSEYFHTRITFSKIQISPFNKIVLKEFCLRAQNNDTLLYAQSLTTGINLFSVTSKALEINTISLEKPKIYFFTDSAHNLNFQFIIDKYSGHSTDTTSSAFDFAISKVKITDGIFRFVYFDKEEIPFGLNYRDMDVSHLNLDVTNFRINNGITSFRIRALSGYEKSGLEIISLEARMLIDKNNMAFNGVHAITNMSELDATQVKMNFRSFREMGEDFINNVVLTVDLNTSRTSTDDIAYFAPSLRNYHFNASVSGRVTGRVSSLRGKNMVFQFGENSVVQGNFDINGLPDIQSSVLYFDVKNLHSSPVDLEQITLPHSKYGHLVLPDILHKVKYFNYTGKFSGFINDFVAYGTIVTNLGKLTSDISIQPDTAHSFSFNGKLKAMDFDIGTLVDQQENIGKISFNAMVNGRNSIHNKLKARMNGQISSFFVKNYDYKNIKVDGTITNKTYDGSMSISDPNIDLNFLGTVNLTKEIPEFNFSARVIRANMYKLNLDTTDTASFLSFYATANFSGKKVDDMSGEIKLWNSTLRKTGKEIHVNDLLLFTKDINDTRRIILRSDLADAEIWGTYQFTELSNTFQWWLRHYLPSLVNRNLPAEKSTANNFKFEAEFKDTRLLTDYFFPGLYISRDSKLEGEYNPYASRVNFKLLIPFINWGGKKIYDVNISSQSTNDVISLNYGCSSFKLNNQFSLDNLTILAEVGKDSVHLVNRWNNWDSLSYKGNIQANLTFARLFNTGLPKMNLDLDNSQVVLADSVWTIHPSSFTIDSSRIAINHLECLFNNQTISAEGAISRMPSEKLYLNCRNLNLNVFNTFFRDSIIQLQGIANGQAELSNLYKNPYFKSNIKIDSLKINKEPLGNTELIAEWDNPTRSIDFEVNAMRGELKTLAVDGVYETLTKKIRGGIHLKKLKLNIFQPFITFLFSDLKGLATGDLDVQGTLEKPVINGEVNVQKVGLTVNYLQTRYSFSKVIQVRDNNILLDDIVVFDSKGNKCMLNGKITNHYLDDFNFNLRFNANNFEFLNTTEKDNILFYGHGFATGTVDITGTPSNLSMVINARTEKGTKLAIPFGDQTADLSDIKYVRFIDKKPKIILPEYDFEKVQSNKEYAVNLDGFKLDLNLEVTPDATAQIIFDSKIGDMIEGNGSGNIRMDINTQGKFNMYGNYTIEQGDYLFTLQNVINKHFKVAQGGTISWKGNPMDATLNIEAVYPAKAALYDLVASVVTSADEYKSRIPINCKINLTGKLLNPEPKFEIELPNSNQMVKTLVNSIISSQDELNKQFISLLVLNSFLPDQNNARNSGSSSQSSSGINPVGSTGYEFLSNQLSHWLSQLSQDFDIGVNYRPGTELTTQELEFALSKQMINDKVSITTNFDMGGTSTTKISNNTNNIVGDFEVVYKPWDSGKVRLKAFNRSNENYTYELSPYTQGVGISYKEDFNTFGELFRKYWTGLFGKKEDDLKVKEDKQSSQNIEE